MTESTLSHSSSMDPPRWIQRYVEVLQKRVVLVIVCWVCVLGAGLLGTIKTFGNLKLQIEPIPGDHNAIAKLALEAHFPDVSKRQLTLVELMTADGSDITQSAAARAAADRLGRFATAYISSGLLSPDSGSSYFNLTDQGLIPLALPLLSSSASAIAIQYFTTEGYVVSERFTDFILSLRDELDATVAASSGALSGRDTGSLPISFDSSTHITKDIGLSDGITVTLSFLLLAFALSSMRLIMLTFAALVASFGGAFLLAWPLTTALSTPNFVTSLMISTLVSLSLDYSLFLLSHLRASLSAGAPMVDAVASMLASPGHTVLVSGCTLAACFLVLAIFPVSIVRAPGIAATFAVVMSVCSSLTLTPALLLAFPNFFAASATSATPNDAALSADIESAAPASSSSPAASDGSARTYSKTQIAALSPASDTPSAAAAEKPTRFSCLAGLQSSTNNVRCSAGCTSPSIWARFAASTWRAVADLTRRYKATIAVIVLALLIAPFAYRLRHFRGGLSQSLRNIAPRGESSVEAYYDVQARFSPGAVANARLIGVSPSPAVAALSPAFFASAAAAVLATVGASGPGELRAEDVSGLAWSNGQAADAGMVMAALGSVSACPASSAAACCSTCSAQACLMRISSAQTLSTDGQAMILRLNIRMDRASADGVAWANRVRKALDSAQSADPFGIRWSLLVDPSADSVDYIYDNFGTLVGVTTAVIFVILAASFQSVTIALRSLVSLAAMEVAVFGAATAIYCDGALSAAPGVLNTFAPDNGLFWLMPILAFSLTAGLGLDYDIFLMTSIVEERQGGYSDDDAVSVGLQRSGPVISWAGAIMAVAYSGFLFSSIPLLNQLGFFIVFAVLLDSFIVRPLLVPATMFLLGRFAYWPRAPPSVTRSLVAVEK